MGILVNVVTGEFVCHDDVGNLCEWLNAMSECEQDVSMYRVYLEDDAYGEIA